MKRLEKKILREVYSFETRQTLLKIVFRLVALISFSLGSIMLAGVVLEQLTKQKTLDMFEIVFEDLETIKENIWEVLATFYLEAPKFEILTVILIIFLTLVMLFQIVLNFTRIKNKINSLIKFWSGR